MSCSMKSDCFCHTLSLLINFICSKLHVTSQILLTFLFCDQLYIKVVYSAISAFTAYIVYKGVLVCINIYCLHCI